MGLLTTHTKIMLGVQQTQSHNYTSYSNTVYVESLGVKYLMIFSENEVLARIKVGEFEYCMERNPCW